jgi:uncharacterized protein
MKNIAVIGAGISGLAAAYLLSRRHRVHLFENEGRLGGHTQTVLIEAPTGTVPLDTGFLMHNDRTYPNLVRLFAELSVATRDSDMSFAVSCRRSALEYSSRGANGFFAQRRNLVSPTHLSLLREIVRFNTHTPCGRGAPGSVIISLGCAPSGSTTDSSACGTCIWDRAKRHFWNDTPDCSSCCW